MKYRIKPYLYSREVYVFHDFLLGNLDRGWDNPHGIVFEKFNETDFDKLEKTLNDVESRLRLFSLEDVKIRLCQGHMLYVAKSGEDIIGYLWIARNSFSFSFFNGTFYLNENEALTFNALIKKEYRGKGIFNRLKAFAFNDLKTMGYERVVGFYWYGNSASVRMNERFGSRIIGSVKFYNAASLSFRWHNLAQDKLVFHDGIFIYWKKLGRKLFKKRVR